jgi:dimethylamine monooxygenase subunit C
VLVTGIKSKPVYAPLQADVRGRHHLMVGSGVGAGPLLRVVAELQAAPAHALKSIQLLYVPDSGEVPATAGPPGTSRDAAASTLERFRQAAVDDVRAFSGTPALLEGFRAILARSLMGTRLYVAGPESFMGLVMKIALEFNLNKDEIRAEECGSLARRVYCIHCRATTESVRTNIVRCVGCERWLLVRDHYSRRLAAYMGVMVDAEAPGELPPIKEVFL